MQPKILLSALLLASTGSAIPVPQFSAPSFDLSRLSSLFGGGSGSRPSFDLGSLFPSRPGTGTPAPETPSAPSTGFPSFGGGFGGGLGGSTANDLKAATVTCRPNVLIFARGTTEPGNMGSVVGPDLKTQINALAPGTFMFQGVDYPASAAGIADGGRAGGDIVAGLVREAGQKCPGVRVMMSGYSQGGMVTHNGFGKLSAAEKATVGGIVTYGDPFQRQRFQGIDASKVKTFCAAGDSVCEGGFAITPAHLSYRGADTRAGAEFLVALKA